MLNNEEKVDIKETIFVAYANHKILNFKNSNHYEYVFTDINQEFESLIGLDKNKIIGKKMTELSEIKENLDFNWAEIYNKIISEKVYIKLDVYSQSLKKWFKVEAFSKNNYYLTTIFFDVTE